MNKSSLCLGCIFTLILGFSFFIFNTEKATGQITSSSSSGGVTISNGFTGEWKAKVVRQNNSSSSSGDISTSSGAIVALRGGMSAPESSSGIIETEHGSSSGGSETESDHGSSSGDVGHGPNNPQGDSHGGDKGSKTISLKLCVVNNSLTGLIEQGGLINKGQIKSTTIISSNEVSVTIQDKNGKSSNVNLKLVGDRQLLITFDSGVKAEGRKQNLFKACFAGVRPQGSSSGGVNPKSPHPENSPHPSTSSSGSIDDNHNG